MWILPFLWTQTSYADVNQMQVSSYTTGIADASDTGPSPGPLAETTPGIWQGSDTIPRSNSLNFCILDRDIQLICPGLDQVPNQIRWRCLSKLKGTPVLEKLGPDPIQQAPAVEEDGSPGGGQAPLHQKSGIVSTSFYLWMIAIEPAERTRIINRSGRWNTPGAQ